MYELSASPRSRLPYASLGTHQLTPSVTARAEAEDLGYQ